MNILDNESADEVLATDLGIFKVYHHVSEPEKEAEQEADPLLGIEYENGESLNLALVHDQSQSPVNLVVGGEKQGHVGDFLEPPSPEFEFHVASGYVASESSPLITVDPERVVDESSSSPKETENLIEVETPRPAKRAAAEEDETTPKKAKATSPEHVDKSDNVSLPPTDDEDEQQFEELKDLLDKVTDSLDFKPMERKASETVTVLQTLHDMLSNRFDVPENEALVEKHVLTSLRLEEALRVAKDEAHLEKLDQDHFRAYKFEFFPLMISLFDIVFRNT